MKKLFLSFLMVCASACLMAGEMTWYNEDVYPFGAPERAQAAAGDTVYFMPQVAQCIYIPDTVVGSYHVALDFLPNTTDPAPRMQFHMRVLDTLRIADTDTNKPLGLIYKDNQGVTYQAVQLRVSLDFLGFDTLTTQQGAMVLPKYSFIGAALMQDGTLLGFAYESYFYQFVNSETGQTYLPTHEVITTALPHLSMEDVAPVRKVMRNGQVLIERTTPDGVRYMDMQGRILAE